MSVDGEQFDIVVLGCGPAGATTAALLAQSGRRVLVLEKASFPRYHIGESLTGTVALYLHRAGLAGEMARRRFPTKYGVKVIGSKARSEFFVSVAPETTWQVRRDEFDQMLLEHAIASGVEHRVTTARGVLMENGRVVGLSCRNGEGEPRHIGARCVVDASGTSCFLSQQGIAGKRVGDEFGDQVAVFSQIRDCELDPGLMAGNTMIFYDKTGVWAWLIPLTDDVVSVGIVIPRSVYKEIGRQVKFEDVSIPRHVFGWGLQNINPDLRRRCGDRELAGPVHVIRDYSYRIAPYAGDGWICVGDSHRFVDPIFSFGVAIAMHEAQKAAEAIDDALARGSCAAPFAEYQRHCDVGQDAVGDVVRYFWRYPSFFGVQARGRFREDIMRLFAGACYDEPPLPGLTMMRESLDSA